MLDGAAAREARIAGGDRVDDRCVLDAHRLDEVAAGRVVAARDAHRLVGVLLEEFEQPAEMRIACRLGEEAVEGPKASQWGKSPFTARI